MNPCSLCGQPTPGRTHAVCASVNAYARSKGNAKQTLWLADRLGQMTSQITLTVALKTASGKTETGTGSLTLT